MTESLSTTFEVSVNLTSTIEKHRADFYSEKKIDELAILEEYIHRLTEIEEEKDFDSLRKKHQTLKKFVAGHDVYKTQSLR